MVFSSWELSDTTENEKSNRIVKHVVGMPTRPAFLENNVGIPKNIEKLSFHVIQQYHFWEYVLGLKKHNVENLTALLCSLQHYTQFPESGNNPSA